MKIKNLTVYVLSAVLIVSSSNAVLVRDVILTDEVKIEKNAEKKLLKKMK